MDLEGLVAEARERRPKPMPARERRIFAAMAVAFVAGAGGIAAAIPHDRHARPLVMAALVVLYALTMRARFEIGNGAAMPTALALVPMLFLAPLRWVPLLGVLGCLLSFVPDFALKKMHPDRWIYALSDNWYLLGPTLVLGLWAPGPPNSHHLGVYLAAAVAQAVLGILNAVVADRLLYGTPVFQMVRLAGWAYGIGSILLPVAYMTATVAARHAIAIGAVVPLLWLLRVFSRERQERYAAALELNQAYRGTVMVLADVVEADDNYTAFHCRSVVELASAVGTELGLNQDELQELEMAALLHDVGKIAIPKEILNKPSRLTEAEFEQMKTHTIEGQLLLGRIGGRLARVGEIVRSCHERWDGRGYPDGLMGEEIAVAARIVFCCDAWSAMTTDRPYRQSLTREAALAELSSCSGTQFEPRVVDAVVRVVGESDVYSTETYSDAVRAVLASHAPKIQLEASA
jgi:HD-GYP domain-containing protein (c-di-GMP phosphodiesterase class II)